MSTHHAPCNECLVGFDSCFPQHNRRCCETCDHTKPAQVDNGPVELAGSPAAVTLRGLAASRGVDLETTVRAAEKDELARIVRLPKTSS